METKLEETEEQYDVGIEYEEEDDDGDDVEYEATLKLLGRKIEETPAAKVIVSDEMMSEALSEVKARKSINLGIPSSIRVDGDTDHALPTASSSSPMTHSGAGDGNHGVDGQPSFFSSENCDDSSGCPLEKVFEFLQALMTKNYKKALDLAKEILEHEPENETVKEYLTVLNEFVKKDKANESESESSTDESLEDENEYSEELSTSSETDSVSEEDGESSGDSNTTSSNEESDDDGGNLEIGDIDITAGIGMKTLEKVARLKLGVSKGDDVSKTVVGVHNPALPTPPST